MGPGGLILDVTRDGLVSSESRGCNPDGAARARGPSLALRASFEDETSSMRAEFGQNPLDRADFVTREIRSSIYCCRRGSVTSNVDCCRRSRLSTVILACGAYISSQLCSDQYTVFSGAGL